MGRGNCSIKATASYLALTLALGFSAGAQAADLPAQKGAPEALVAVDPWTGFYFGGHISAATGWSGWTSGPMAPFSGTSQAVSHDGQTGPLNGGFQGGYNWMVDPHWLTGVEADITFPDIQSASHINADGSQTIDQIQMYGALRGRLGYASGNWLVYATGGAAYAREQVANQFGGGMQVNAAGDTLVDFNYLTRWGYAAGAGAELKLSPQWGAKFEFMYDGFASSHVFMANSGQSYTSNLSLYNFTAGLNYHFGVGEQAGGFLPNMDNWSIHGQSTTVYQASMPMYAAYNGPQSLGPAYVARDTVSSTLFLGYRLQPGTEIYFNPEPFQGFGLSSTHGLGGFSNGEAQKGGFPFPHYNTARLFVRETIGLGGEQETVDDAANQFGGKVDVSRLTFTIGRMSVTDIFDQNAYSHDPRNQFMNFSLMDGGAFDYAADQKGYTWGAVGELNQKAWAARAGVYLEPSVPNGNDFDTSLRSMQEIVELEERHTIYDQPGKLRFTSWIDWANSGVFSQWTPDNVASICSLTVTTTCSHNLEYGFIVNLEQAVTSNIGVFSRASWRNGQTTIMGWTDIDKSVSLGTSIKGALWGRESDTIGVAGVINGLSNAYQNFLGAGGLGINIGDGALSYSGEKIIETYYNVGLTSWANLTLDYQFVGSPAYNSARGPANILSARYHMQF